MTPFKSKSLIPFVYFLVLSGIIIFSWFRFGYIYGGGDVGLQTYDPTRILQIIKYVWWDSTAPGSPTPQGLSAIPLQFGLSLLQSVGFSPLLLQATLFFILLFTSGFGMYLFLKRKLEEKDLIFPILGGTFYMLNPYMMVQVWHRFIHTTIILASVLPFMALFWDSWIKKGKLKSLMLFLLTNFIAVYIFGTFAFIITIWVFLLMITISNFFPWQSRGLFLEIVGRLFFGIIVWLLLNSWYLFPVTQISPAILSEQHKSSESLSTLINISRQSVLPYTLQLANPFYLFEQAELGEIYKNPLFQTLPWIFVLTILIGLINSFKIKPISLYGILFLISLFLVKGAAPPFGNAYIYGFKNIFALGVLRNPFEKTGLILVFFATVLFVLGLKIVSNYFKRKSNFLISKIVVIFLMLSIIIFAWPMFKGTILGRYDKPTFVQVPKSYKKADEWLNMQKKMGVMDGKILHLPLTRGESVRYKWEYGYNGLESSPLLFTSYPSISRGFNIQRIDDSLTALSLIFHQPYSENSNHILQLLNSFNVRFIVLHRDLYWFATDTFDSKEIEGTLNNLKFIDKKIDFGDLVIYQLKDEFFSPEIEIKDVVSIVYPSKANIRMWPYMVSEDRGFILPIKNNDLDTTFNLPVKQTLIFPESSFSFPEASGSALENTVNQLNSRIEVIVGTVEYLKGLGIIQKDTERIVSEIVSSSQKLIEMFTTKKVNNYAYSINNLSPFFAKDSNLYLDIPKNIVLDILKFHLVILTSFENQFGKISENSIIEGNLKKILRSENVLPIYTPSAQTIETGQRQFFDFWINEEGEYELLLTDSKIKNYYVNQLGDVTFQVNDQLKTLLGKDLGNLISYGKVPLNQGINEISFINPPSVNLAANLNDFTNIGMVTSQDNIVSMIVSKNAPAAIESPILHASGEDIYQISFDGQIPANVGFYIQVIQDTDDEENGQKLSRISFLQHLNNRDWQGNISIKLPALGLQTREAKIRLIALIPDGYLTLNSSKVLLKNLKIVRVLNNGLFLRQIGSSFKEDNSSKITFKKIDSVTYQGNLKLTKPQFIFFKTSYHPGWKLQLVSNKQVVESKNHYLSDLYGNAWYVDQIGEYDFKIIFEPQKTFLIGIVMSSLGVLTIISYYIISRKLNK